MQMRAAVGAMVAGALLSGCGGGGGVVGSGTPDIADVRACLTQAGLKAEDFSKQDRKVSKGVFATGGLEGEASPAAAADRKEFTFAVAALVRDEKTVTQFEKDTKEFSETLSIGEQKLVIDSGTSGRYVWVVGGAKGAPAYDEARDCVKD